ncbi:TPR domain protein [hydrothermal vent metagenome]|uniref:TPR domain protein n=1 Tax=hydrothermal vent metagenome TaxID=652676 RepID=A0A1W1C0G2_9ZZZZ
MPPETNACFACHKDKTLDQLQNDLKKWGNLEWEKLESPHIR